MIIRTQEEIINKYKNKNEGFFSFASDLLEFLPFDKVKTFLNEEYIKKIESGEEAWKQNLDPKQTSINYLEFAWGKANDCRGLSAHRSINHFLNWIWLFDDEFYKKLQESYSNNYNYYGKPQLVSICNFLDVDWKQYDNKCWTECEDWEESSEEKINKIINDLSF